MVPRLLLREEHALQPQYVVEAASCGMNDDDDERDLDGGCGLAGRRMVAHVAVGVEEAWKNLVDQAWTSGLASDEPGGNMLLLQLRPPWFDEVEEHLAAQFENSGKKSL